MGMVQGNIIKIILIIMITASTVHADIIYVSDDNLASYPILTDFNDSYLYVGANSYYNPTRFARSCFMINELDKLVHVYDVHIRLVSNSDAIHYGTQFNVHYSLDDLPTTKLEVDNLNLSEEYVYYKHSTTVVIGSIIDIDITDLIKELINEVNYNGNFLIVLDSTEELSGPGRSTLIGIRNDYNNGDPAQFIYQGITYTESCEMCGSSGEEIIVDSITPYIPDLGYYSDWTDQYYENYTEAQTASTINVAGQEVLISKAEFQKMTGNASIIFTGIILLAWFKAII